MYCFKIWLCIPVASASPLICHLYLQKPFLSHLFLLLFICVGDVSGPLSSGLVFPSQQLCRVWGWTSDAKNIATRLHDNLCLSPLCCLCHVWLTCTSSEFTQNPTMWHLPVRIVQRGGQVYLYLRMWLLWNNQKMTSYFCDSLSRLLIHCCSLESYSLWFR